MTAAAAHVVAQQAYSEESLAIIKKQREIIEKLQKENEVCCDILFCTFPSPRVVHEWFRVAGGCGARKLFVCRRAGQSMKTELDLEARVSQRRALGDSTLSQLNDQIDMYTEKVEVERRNAEQLATQARCLSRVPRVTHILVAVAV